MSKQKRSHHDIVDAALSLDGDPDKVRRFYDDWADRYDEDVAGFSYVGPRLVAGLVEKHAGLLEPVGKADLSLLDAGCGTGLAGKELHDLGFRHIQGFDLSSEMVAHAAASDHYESVIGGVDIMKAGQHYEAGTFDIVVCVGVFTLGHVPPQALEMLVRLMRPGGLLAVSTRTEYYQETDYPQVARRLIEGGTMRLVEGIESAHYLDGSRSHFWVYQVIA